MKLLPLALLLLCTVVGAIAQSEPKTLTVSVFGPIADQWYAEDEKRDLPRQIQLPSDSSILDLFVAVGGIGQSGHPGKITLKRTLTNGTTTTIKIDAIKELKNYLNAVKLVDGDVINIVSIFDRLSAPEFFNSLLWGYGTFHLQHREPTTEWKNMLKYLGDDRTGDTRWPSRETIEKQALDDYFFIHPNAPRD